MLYLDVWMSVILVFLLFVSFKCFVTFKIVILTQNFFK
jgi:hypothetical protein